MPVCGGLFRYISPSPVANYSAACLALPSEKMSQRLDFEVVRPNDHEQTVAFSRKEFEAELKSGALVFHCNSDRANTRRDPDVAGGKRDAGRSVTRTPDATPALAESFGSWSQPRDAWRPAKRRRGYKIEQARSAQIVRHGYHNQQTHRSLSCSTVLTIRSVAWHKRSRKSCGKCWLTPV